MTRILSSEMDVKNEEEASKREPEDEESMSVLFPLG